MNFKDGLWHALAFLVAATWGSTFVASKILLMAGYTPAEVVMMRFFIAWLLLWLFTRKSTANPNPAKSLPHRLRRETMFLLLGLSGGSLYFLAENSALLLTTSTSTVALLVCTTPILTALLNRLVHREEHLSNRFLMGSCVALLGVSLVIFNGVFVIEDNPWVILLSLLAALLWGVYSLLIRRAERHYSASCLTRNVFFYGMLTMLPVRLIQASQTGRTWVDLFLPCQDPSVLFTLLFLALIASLGCFLLWNVTLRHISLLAAGNYLYFNPVSSLIVAYLVLNERITPLALVGCALTIAGVYVCNRPH